MVRGSCSFKAFNPPCGILNGLCIKSSLPSLFSSYIGKSVIQAQATTLGSFNSKKSPSLSRNLPKTLFTKSLSSAPKKIMSPSCAPVLSIIVLISCSERNFKIGERNSFSTIIYAKPPAPSFFTISVSSSIWERLKVAPPWQQIAFTTPPFFMALPNTVN